MPTTNDLSPQPTGPQVDLTNCDREPIHALGRVQSFGCLLALSSDWVIAHASRNCGDLIGLDSEALIGTRFVEHAPEASVHHLRTRMQAMNYADGVRLFAYDFFGDGRLFDISVHRSGRTILLEFEPRTSPANGDIEVATVQALLARVRRHNTLDRMVQEAARALKALLDLDRVMVYRFAPDGSGSVIAEAAQPGAEPYLGLRYPASDVPKQARALYTRSVLRLISDVNDPGVPVDPALGADGEPLDMSMAVTRAVSPIHLEYLRNMGVGASMSVSILRRGELWGLFACHHGTPFYVSHEKRSAAELFAQLFNYELAQLEAEEELKDVERAQHLHDQMMSQLSGGQSIWDTFEMLMDTIREVIPHDGAALYSDGTYRAYGLAPTQEEFLGLARFLNTSPTSSVFATESIAGRYANARGFGDRVAGVLALPISRTPRDYLVLFRREVVQTVTWAGNPDKPAEPGPNGLRLTPRKSFDAWKETVQDHATPWKPSELRAAEALRVTLLEVVLKLADETNVMRKRAQEQQELLIAELNHRVRNILNLIRGLVSQGRNTADTLEGYSKVLDARIHALARAHDQLTERSWSWLPFAELLDNEVAAFLTEQKDRVSLSGAGIDLDSQAFTTLALVIHELVTNSVKYGALSDPNGAVSVTVGVDGDGVARLTWQETGGPPVQAPSRRGFGTTIIERSVPFELRGTADVRFRVTGLEAEFTVPGKYVRPSQHVARPQREVAQDKPARSLTGDAVVVEDNMIIALDASDMLTDLGASSVQTAGDLASALALLDAQDVSFALVDVNLGQEMSLPFADRCADANIPMVLATGYGAADELIERYPGVPIVRKPYTIDHLRRALAEL